MQAGNAEGKQKARQLGWRAFNVANWPGAEARRVRCVSLRRAWPVWSLTALSPGTIPGGKSQNTRLVLDVSPSLGMVRTGL